MSTPSPNRIASIRKAKGLSQQQLAETVGSHWITISKLERGRMQLTAQWMERLANALGVQPTEFLKIESSPRGVPVVGYIHSGGMIEVLDEEKEIRLTVPDISPVASSWLGVKSNEFEPFFFYGDVIHVINIANIDIQKVTEKIGLIHLLDGRILFGLLQSHIGGMIFDVRTLQHTVIRSVEVEGFSIFAGGVSRFRDGRGPVGELADRA